jgi:hypothetical protein
MLALLGLEIPQQNRYYQETAQNEHQGVVNKKLILEEFNCFRSLLQV